MCDESIGKERVYVMRDSRKLIFNENFVPIPKKDGDEIFPNGVFHINVSRILADIQSGVLQAERERINVKEWFIDHFRPMVNEKHLPYVDLNEPVIQAEIRPGKYSIIDGNHRMEKAIRENVDYIDSYKLRGEQLIPYIVSKEGYKAFVNYWNLELI